MWIMAYRAHCSVRLGVLSAGIGKYRLRRVLLTDIVKNFVDNSCCTPRKARRDLRYDKTMKFWAELIYLKSMSYTDSLSFWRPAPGLLDPTMPPVDDYPANVEGFARV